jgi:uncharacterized protein (DUF302 family)
LYTEKCNIGINQTHKTEKMSYYFRTTLIAQDFEAAIAYVTEALKKGGFGIVTEINMQATLKQKINADIRKYHILGACNPKFAYEALLLEDKVGLLLPCNVVIEESETGEIIVSAIDPVSALLMTENKALVSVAEEVQQKLRDVIGNL